MPCLVSCNFLTELFVICCAAVVFVAAAAFGLMRCEFVKQIVADTGKLCNQVRMFLGRLNFICMQISPWPCLA